MASFERDTDYLLDRITLEQGRSQDSFEKPLEVPTWSAEPGRYRLVAAWACPWANRAIIARQLLGLEDVISMGVCGPTHDERSWTFDLDVDGRDPVLGMERLQEGYLRRDPAYAKGITVPAMVDVVSDPSLVIPKPPIGDNGCPWMLHPENSSCDVQKP